MPSPGLSRSLSCALAVSILALGCRETTAPEPHIKLLSAPESIELGLTDTVSAELTGGMPAVMWQSSDAGVVAVESVSPTEARLRDAALGKATITVIGVADTTRRESVEISVIPV